MAAALDYAPVHSICLWELTIDISYAFLLSAHARYIRKQSLVIPALSVDTLDTSLQHGLVCEEESCGFG